MASVAPLSQGLKGEREREREEEVQETNRQSSKGYGDPRKCRYELPRETDTGTVVTTLESQGLVGLHTIAEPPLQAQWRRLSKSLWVTSRT